MYHVRGCCQTSKGCRNSFMSDGCCGAGKEQHIGHEKYEELVTEQ